MSTCRHCGTWFRSEGGVGSPAVGEAWVNGFCSKTCWCAAKCEDRIVELEAENERLKERVTQAEYDHKFVQEKWRRLDKAHTEAVNDRDRYYFSLAKIRTEFAGIFPDGTASNHEAARKIAEILGEVE